MYIIIIEKKDLLKVMIHETQITWKDNSVSQDSGFCAGQTETINS